MFIHATPLFIQEDHREMLSTYCAHLIKPSHVTIENILHVLVMVLFMYVSLKFIVMTYNKQYLIKNGVLCLIDSFTESLDPSLFILRSLCLKFDILDLKWTQQIYKKS